ncbi:MAG: hypothetical protein Q8P51_10155 [Ignavibacteria bacterium]|nr:hypothetical protein [Ignavibacteria bacterium]
MNARPIIPALLTLVIVAAHIGCSDRGPTEPSDQDSTHTGPIARKPNIYLYPTTNQQISVRVLFPSGGRILESHPAYGTGWVADVDPNGRINQQYDYLYYEAQTADRYQYTFGWTIQRDTAADFFRHVLHNGGFIEREIKDFLEYWVPRLTSANYYSVYPQQRDLLENLIRLDVVPKPQTVLRLFFVIRTTEMLGAELPEPHLQSIQRTGYALAEWGVVIQ